MFAIQRLDTGEFYCNTGIDFRSDRWEKDAATFYNPESGAKGKADDIRRSLEARKSLGQIPSVPELKVVPAAEVVGR